MTAFTLKEVFMSAAIHTELVQGKKFVLVWGLSDQPEIEYQGKNYSSLVDLIADAPFLADPSNLLQYIHIANFLFTGLDFSVIEDAEDYKKRYQTSAGKFIREYGIYDVTSISTPYVEGNNLIFFAENNSSGVPYKAVSTYPYARGGNSEYALLPQVPSK
jgi:hypothetical protein